tara:strand:+ start:58 stop:168 length:111 start_codon:yes stop_codon:yes gene_type:complete
MLLIAFMEIYFTPSLALLALSLNVAEADLESALLSF